MLPGIGTPKLLKKCMVITQISKGKAVQSEFWSVLACSSPVLKQRKVHSLHSVLLSNSISALRMNEQVHQGCGWEKWGRMHAIFCLPMWQDRAGLQWGVLEETANLRFHAHCPLQLGMFWWWHTFDNFRTDKCKMYHIAFHEVPFTSILKNSSCRYWWVQRDSWSVWKWDLYKHGWQLPMRVSGGLLLQWQATHLWR